MVYSRPCGLVQVVVPFGVSPYLPAGLVFQAVVAAAAGAEVLGTGVAPAVTGASPRA